MNHRALFESFLKAALVSVCPRQAIAKHVSRRGNQLRIGRRSYDLGQFAEVRLVAVGKAAVPMAAALIPLVRDQLSRGVIVTKKGYFKKSSMPHERAEPAKFDTRIKVIESSHPTPDASSVRAGRAIAEVVANASEKTLLLCCISGGASSLMILPKPGITLASYRHVNQLLLASGADIVTLNGVRKALDRLKGGGLAQMAQPAQILSLIISDVIGDPIGIIGSGPTHHPGVYHFLVGNNALACRAVADAARKAGFKPQIITTKLRAQARDAGAQIARDISKAPAKSVHIYGGETTVTLGGKSGKGGRNQELVLAAAIEFSKMKTGEKTALLSFGTDGIDGDSPAAGAFCTGETLARSKSLGLSALQYLREHNSHPYFKALGDLMITGQTGTNVADVTVALRF